MSTSSTPVTDSDSSSNSTDDSTAATVTSSVYDTVQCQIEYHGVENFDHYVYEVNDYHTSDLIFFDAATDAHQASFSSYLDTAQNGTDDWNIIQD